MIIPDEAETIDRLYALYERFGTVRAVVHEARRLGLLSRRRIGSDGQVSGGIAFGRGHIHRLLTNPIYAVRVRHRDKVYDGQHAAIIAPDRWDRIQQQMQDGAAKVRARKTAASRSSLCAKLFDQTRDRLTPSQSRTKAATRLRYDISHRLAARSGEDHHDAWRLPAEELERKVATIVTRLIGKKTFVGTLMPNASADQIRRAAATLSDLADGAQDPLFELVARIDLSPGALTLSLDSSNIGATLDVDPGTIEPTLLISEHPFQLRKRGVESRIVLANVPHGRDDTLIRNIAKANAWFERIKAGETFSQIAEAEQTPKRRIGQMIHLAFLAPDIVRDVLEGKQPIGFTSDWCKTRELPIARDDQRRILATL